ncbi:MAG: hypothetical protein AAGI92_05560 [Pseudomonadota bacterium]
MANGFDWAFAVKRQRDAFRVVVAMLASMVGLVDGDLPPRDEIFPLPRRVHTQLLQLLRPAESALRRLIFVYALGALERMRPGSGVVKEAAPLPDFSKFNAAREGGSASKFPLIDPRKDFSYLWRDEEAGVASPSNAPTHEIEKPISPVLVMRRVAALAHAYETMPKQAKRMAHWLRAMNGPRSDDVTLPPKLHPIRPGAAPGYTEKPANEADDLLCECEHIAGHALNYPEKFHHLT